MERHGGLKTHLKELTPEERAALTVGGGKRGRHGCKKKIGIDRESGKKTNQRREESHYPGFLSKTGPAALDRFGNLLGMSRPLAAKETCNSSKGGGQEKKKEGQSPLLHSVRQKKGRERNYRETAE